MLYRVTALTHMGSPVLEIKHSMMMLTQDKKGALLPIANGTEPSPLVPGNMVSLVQVSLLGNSILVNTTTGVSLPWASEIILHESTPYNHFWNFKILNPC